MQMRRRVALPAVSSPPPACTHTLAHAHAHTAMASDLIFLGKHQILAKNAEPGL